MTSREGCDTPVAAILVRHAQPDVQPDRPAGMWPLRPEGWQAAQALGRRLRVFRPLQVVTSDEVKAIQTGNAIGTDEPGATDARFGEQGLGTVPFYPDDVFRERVLAHFRHPDRRVLGDEASSEAVARFDTAVKEAISVNGNALPVIVSHGRIISAWLTAHTAPDQDEPLSADALWASLRMPDAFLLRPHTNHADAGIRWTYERMAIAPGTGADMGPLGQALINGVVVAMVVALFFLIVSYPNAERLTIALVLGTVVGVVTYLRARRA